MADTTTLGFITPTVEDESDRPLEDIFQVALKGITGVEGKYVRPQAPDVIPNIPEVSVDWISFRVASVGHDFDAHHLHKPALLVNGESEVSRDEQLELFVSFYGPLGHRYMSRWVNGLAIDQNRWTLMDHGIKLTSLSKPVYLPSLLKEQWQRRYDLRCFFSRRLHTTYPVRSISSADIGLNNEYYITPIIVTQP